MACFIIFHDFYSFFILFMKDFTYFQLLQDFSDVLFLYFSWLELKYLEIFLFSYTKTLSYFIPLSKKWFYRTSFLLKHSKYSYFPINSVKKFFKRSSFTLLFYQNKVIENSIFNVIFPFFRNNYFFKNISLLEHLMCGF